MIHLEQLVDLTKWKDLKKEQRNKIHLLKWGGWSRACFLAVQNSSTGDLVTDSVTDSLAFTFDIQRAILQTCDDSDI